MYVHDISSGNTTSDSEPKLVKETAATAYVDGQNLLGPVVGNFSMKIAIEKAKQSGVGWVVASGKTYEQRHEKINNVVLRTGPTQTKLYRHRRWLEL